MSKGNSTEQDFIDAVFKDTTPAWLGVGGNVYISLHTDDPGEAGTQLTNEATYTSYARVAVARTAGGWTTGSGSASNAGLLQFPTCTGALDDELIKYVAIGTVALPGAGQILYSGSLTANRRVTDGIQPQFAIGALVVNEE